MPRNIHVGYADGVPMADRREEGGPMKGAGQLSIFVVIMKSLNMSNYPCTVEKETCKAH